MVLAWMLQYISIIICEHIDSSCTHLSILQSSTYFNVYNTQHLSIIIAISYLIQHIYNNHIFRHTYIQHLSISYSSAYFIINLYQHIWTGFTHLTSQSNRSFHAPVPFMVHLSWSYIMKCKLAKKALSFIFLYANAMHANILIHFLVDFFQVVHFL